MTIYKVEIDRFDSVKVGNAVFYVKNKLLTSFDLNSKEITPVANIESDGIQVLQNQPKHIYHNTFNSTAVDLLMNYEYEEGCAVLMTVKRDAQKQFVTEQRKFDNLKNAVFASKDKICALNT